MLILIVVQNFGWNVFSCFFIILWFVNRENCRVILFFQWFFYPKANFLIYFSEVGGVMNVNFERFRPFWPAYLRCLIIYFVIEHIFILKVGLWSLIILNYRCFFANVPMGVGCFWINLNTFCLLKSSYILCTFFCPDCHSTWQCTFHKKVKWAGFECQVMPVLTR